MRNFIFPVLLALSLVACSTYQYVTLDSPQLQKNYKKEFVYENDTLKLVYNFYGEGGPMNLTVYNKTTQPLYIDWKKSALIKEGQSISLFNANVNVNGSIATTSYQPVRSVTSSASGLSASFTLPQGTDFIPPGSYLNKVLLNVMGSAIRDMAMFDSLPVHRVSEDGVATSKFRDALYDETRSPVHFITYLTLMSGGNAEKEFTVQFPFYVKEVMQSDDGPALFGLYRQEGDNLFVRLGGQ